MAASETILLVEDNAHTREAVRRILESAGYTVIPAETPMEAIDLVSNRRVLVHALVTDIGLLGVTGPQLARLIVGDRPELRVLYISGQTATEVIPPGRVGPGTAFLQKPFSGEALLQQLRALLDTGAGRRTEL